MAPPQFRRLLAVFFLLAAASPLFSQEKRLFSTWFDFNPEIESGKKKNYNVLPLFVSSPERGQGFGIKYAQADLLRKDDVVRLQAIQTLKNKSSYELLYEFPTDLVSFFSRFGGEFEMVYENYTKFYYGIGNEANKEDESEYTPEFFTVKVPFLFGITDRVSAGVALNYENWSHIQMGQTGVLQRDLPNLTGKDGSRLYTTSLLLRWDSRNSKTDPSLGNFLETNLEYSKKLLGSETDFRRTTFEYRGFYPCLWFPNSPAHVFGFRLFLDHKSGDVPFYHLPELGGIFFNRGLIEGRFRDSLSLTGNWEYRFRIYQRLHWAFFVDGGNVFSGFKTIAVRGTKITGGTGMRYYVPPGDLLLARVDAGYSNEGLQIYLTFDHPF